MKKKYPRQLIKEISNNLSQELKLFYNIKHHIYFPETNSLDDIVLLSMNKHFKEMAAREELLPIINTIKKSKLKKKTRWYNSFCNDIDMLSISDKNHPASDIISNINTLTPSEYMKIYGDMQLNDIIDNLKKDVEEWKNSTDSLLVSYPLISKYTTSSIYNSFLTDIILETWEYLNENLGGDINYYTSKFPEYLAYNPFFSPTAFNLELNENGAMLNDIIEDEAGNFLLEVAINPNKTKANPIKSMDFRDASILNTLLQNIRNNFYYDKIVSIDLNSLIKHTFDTSTPSKAMYESVVNRLLKFTDYSYKIISNNDKISFNFFDNVEIKRNDNGSSNVFVTFGEMLHNSIVKHKLISVTNKELHTLEDKLSKIIFYALQKERISTIQSGKKSSRLSYQYFQKIARFKSKSKKINIKLIDSALSEFCNKNIAIESYLKDDDTYIVTYISLSNEEIEDLNLEKATHANRLP